MTIEIVCHELIVMTRVVDDIQSSWRKNADSCLLILKPPLVFSSYHPPLAKRICENMGTKVFYIPGNTDSIAVISCSLLSVIKNFGSQPFVSL